MESAEARLSRFQAGSELSRLNDCPEQDVVVSPLLWQCLEGALTAAHRSHGIYDPTILSALEAAGYDRPFADLRPANDARRSPGQPTGQAWRRVKLNRQARTVRLPRGVRVDLGGVGKAWLAERVADMLGAIGPCLVDAGGDIALRGEPPGEQGWSIGVADPRCPDEDLMLLTVSGRAVATSGVDYRHWRHGTTVGHHIIDPRTGSPADTDLLTVTVIARSADEANMHALVALILGAAPGRRYLDSQPDVDGLLVRSDGAMLRTRGFAYFEGARA
jgi:thiamine biosynthesis lipoprotein